MSISVPRAVLLDLDGTIVTSIESAEAGWRAVCSEAAESLGVAPDRLYAAVITSRDWFWGDPERSRIGRGDLRAASRQVVEAALATLGLENRPVARAMAEAFRDRRDRFVVVPGAMETLRHLRAGGVRLALLTNGAAQLQRAKIDQFALEPLFDGIFIEGEIGVGKPDERIYRRALDELAVRAGDAWMVGDDLEWDVAAPQRLGIYAIWVDAPGAGLPRESPIRPDRVISSLASLAELLPASWP